MVECKSYLTADGNYLAHTFLQPLPNNASDYNEKDSRTDNPWNKLIQISL
jgi:hypothetical protein